MKLVVKYNLTTMIFKEFSPREYYLRFPDDESCMEYLADIKWSDGYHCRHCGHTCFMPGKKAHSRRCKSCKYDESATSHTLFHKLKFPITKAFDLIFAISSRKKSVSTLTLSEELELHYETCLNFRRKVQSAMASSGNFPLTGKVEVDETAIGGYDPESQGRAKGDKKLIAVAIERRDGQIGRAYAVPIADYSAKEIRKVFDAHISTSAEVRTDKWTGYMPIKQAYPLLEQEKSKNGLNFEKLHIHIMNIKSWIRGVHHHISEQYINRYLDEFHFRFNRRSFRNSIFHQLMVRLVEAEPILHVQLQVKET